MAEPYARPLASLRRNELDPGFLEDHLNLLERSNMGTEAILKPAYRVGILGFNQTPHRFR